MSEVSPIAELFRRITLGVYAVGVTDGQRRDAFTAAWVMQASFDPLMLAVSINPDNASYELLHATGSFTVNVLKRDQLDLARRLALDRAGMRTSSPGLGIIRVAWDHRFWRKRWHISNAN